MKKLVAIFMVVGLIVTLVFTCGMIAEDESIDLAILMYHNVLPDKLSPSKYEICVKDLASDMRYIKEAGYRVVSPQELVRYTTDTKFYLPKKCVMLTFDDGFYYYNKYLGELLDEYDMTAIVSVVGDFTKFNKSNTVNTKYIYMDYDDMALLQNSGRVNIAAHSFNLHKLGNRTGAKKMSGESDKNYREVFMTDCEKLENKLSEVNIKPICYTYPYGAFCRQSEEMVRERGYKMSLTCNEKVNRVTRNTESLYSLGRYNRHGSATSAERILSKVMPL